MNYLDLFSGIGGFSLGLINAGIKIEKHYFSEIDKNAIYIYKKHFPEAVNLGDIKSVNKTTKIGKIDLITFGFPCQDLSVAGKQKGLDGQRSGLFFEAVRLIKELQPTYFIFENVKGLLFSNKGKDFKRCLQEIGNLGFYDCEWQLVNSSWVLPQNRERVYFIGHLRGKSKPKVFPIREINKEINKICRPKVNTITTRYAESESAGAYIIERELISKTKTMSQGKRVKSIRGNSVCLSSGGGGFGGKTGLYFIPNNKELKIRKLTPLECERLQGFPDNWTVGLTDNARYKLLGNAITVPIFEIIAKRLFLKLGSGI